MKIVDIPEKMNLFVQARQEQIKSEESLQHLSDELVEFKCDIIGSTETRKERRG